jgi:inhibitor of KinA sporulation pathway (predicted exonuclease)
VNYIIYDLEINHDQNRELKQKKANFRALIEIGAMKLSRIKGELRIVDQFQSFVNPGENAVLQERIINLTGIQQGDIDHAPPISEVLPNFMNWASEDALFISWGTMDKKWLYQFCQQINLGVEWFKDSHINIQKQISISMGHPVEFLSLQKVLEILGIKPTGRHHSAKGDAENTSHVFIKTFDQLDLSDCLSLTK